MDNGNLKLIRTHLDAIINILEDSEIDRLIKWNVNSNILQIKQTLKLNKE